MLGKTWLCNCACTKKSVGGVVFCFLVWYFHPSINWLFCVGTGQELLNIISRAQRGNRVVFPSSHVHKSLINVFKCKERNSNQDEGFSKNHGQFLYPSSFRCLRTGCPFPPAILCKDRGKGISPTVGWNKFGRYLFPIGLQASALSWQCKEANGAMPIALIIWPCRKWQVSWSTLPVAWSV